MHSKDLEIDSEKVQLKDLASNATIAQEKLEFDLENEFLIVNLKSKLEQGKLYELMLPFEGELKEGLLGYYRSSYFDQKEQVKK